MSRIIDVLGCIRLDLIMGVALSTILIGGCSSSPKKPEIDQAKIRQFASRGYDSGTEYATSITKSSLNTGNGFRPITIIQPSRDGKYPLVIYLPGLGESSDAGADIRNAWARSGYVVLSIQPLEDDENVWSSKAARSADFTYIRHERYSSEVISERLNILTKLIEHLKQRVASGDSSLQHMDLSRIAVVGFDVGASSAMIVAGEDVPSITVLPVQVNGVIALSPYAEFSSEEFNERYRNINIPVLSITSDADSDTHGSVPPSLHQAPFQYMPSGNKYLLLLAGASHSVIGDDNSAKTDSADGDGNEKQTRNGSTGGNSGKGQRGNRHGRKSSDGGSGFERGSERLSKREAGGSPTQRATMKVAIEQVTTAFLNAHIKDDKYSQEWLKKDAQPWLDKIGQLKEK